MWKNTFLNRSEAKTDIRDFIEMFYNSINRHSHTGSVSPYNFKKSPFEELRTV